MSDIKNISSRQAELDSASARHAVLETETQWFAARIISGEAVISKQLAVDGIHCYRTKYARGILFLRCTAGYTADLVSNYYGRIYFYLNPERKFPAPIPEKQMNNFILVTSVADDLIPLGEVSRDFLKGERVRVTGGLFEGAEGIIKRIKGDRRLVVSIDCFTAVATCYIRPEFLEKA